MIVEDIRSPHCLSYALARRAEGHGQYVLRLEWDAAVGLLQGVRRSEDLRRDAETARARAAGRPA